MRRSIIRLLLSVSILSAVGSARASAETAANDDPAVVSAVSGGGDVRETYSGYTVRRRDGQAIHWTRSYDGYYATLNGKSARLSRTYGGFRVIGADASSVSRTYDGFVVRSDRGPSARWTRSLNGYVGTVNGKNIRLSQSYDGFSSIEYPAVILAHPEAPPKTVKRMPLSKPSSFRRWPAAADR